MPDITKTTKQNYDETLFAALLKAERELQYHFTSLRLAWDYSADDLRQRKIDRLFPVLREVRKALGMSEISATDPRDGFEG
jgi:hypothetical protein